MSKRNMVFNRLYLTGLIIIFILALFAGVSCTGDPPTTLLKGKFVAGGSVKGLEYKSGHKQGRTDDNGDFYYNPGDAVTFSVGGVQIGKSATGAIVMSPVHLVDEDEFHVIPPTALNMARLFQALDLDGNLDNGIALTDDIKNEFADTDIPFNISSDAFDAHPSVQELLFRLNDKNIFPDTRELPLVDQAKQNLISNLLENNVKLPSVLINLGDEWACGSQSGSDNITELTQPFGYAQVLFDLLKLILDLTWYNPLLDADKIRKDSTILPYNIGVPGATVASLLNEETGSGNNPLLDTLIEPMASENPMTQLTAAHYLADENPTKLKFITLGIGNNDVLAAIAVDNGTTRLSTGDIDTFLEGHDLDSVETGLTEIIQSLTKIDDSYIFVANIPKVTDMGAIFSNSDIESLAGDGASVSALTDGDYLGFTAFLNLGTALMDEDTLDSEILTAIAGEGNLLHLDDV